MTVHTLRGGDSHCPTLAGSFSHTVTHTSNHSPTHTPLFPAQMVPRELRQCAGQGASGPRSDGRGIPRSAQRRGCSAIGYLLLVCLDVGCFALVRVYEEDFHDLLKTKHLARSVRVRVITHCYVCLPHNSSPIHAVSYRIWARHPYEGVCVCHFVCAISCPSLYVNMMWRSAAQNNSRNAGGHAGSCHITELVGMCVWFCMCGFVCVCVRLCA